VTALRLPALAALAVLSFLSSRASAVAAAYDSVVVINEIHYHPASATEGEWIELRNQQGVDVNLSRWSITGGIEFTFPDDLTIPGGGHLVIAANPGQIPGALGPFSGSLNNAGEVVRLRNRNGRIMDEVEYADGGDWPTGPDGTGVTLARRDTSAGDNPARWTASNEIGGTPGNPNFFEPNGPPIRNRVVGTDSVWSYADTGSAPPAAWGEPGFDASAWPAGPGLFASTDASTEGLLPALTGVNQTMIGWWQLKETEGTAAANQVAGRPAGTLINGVTWVNDPVRGPVAEFDGVDDRISITATFIPRQTAITEFTWSCWVKSAASASVDTPEDGQDGPLEQGEAVILGNRSKFDGSGNMNPFEYIKLYPSGATYRRAGLAESLTATTPVEPASGWVHLALVRKGSLLTTYLNGQPNGTRPITAGQAAAMPFFIGGDPLNAAECFKGRISDVAVWTRALPERSIAGLSSGQYTPVTAPTAQGATAPASPPLPAPLVGTTVQTGPEPRYFRTTFTVDEDPGALSLELWPLADDGAVYRLNGVEIHRANVPPATATGTAAFPAAPIALPGAALRRGLNVLAAEVHQFAGSPDLLFGAELVTVRAATAPADASPSLVFSEISGAGDPDFKVELLNNSTTAVPLDGWSLRASSGETVALASQSLAPGARLVLDAAALGFSPVDGTRLALFAPGGRAFADARAVTARLRGLTASGQWAHPDAPSFGAVNPFTVNDTVVINEIFYKSRSASPEQWIELHNKGAAPVDVGGWKFTTAVDCLFPAGTTIPAGGFLVVAWDPAAFAALHSGLTAIGPWSGSLSGKGERIRLRDTADNIVDEVPYFDSGRWSEWADGGGASLELKDPFADNSRGEAWDASDESDRGEWQTLTYEGLGTSPNMSDSTYKEFVMGLLTAGEVLIDDVSVIEAPTGANRQLIQNRDFSSGEATFWRLIGNHRPSSVIDDPFAPGNKVLKLSASGPTEHMSNHAETTLKAGSTFISSISSSLTYNISLRARWLRGSNQLNTRLWHNRLPRTTILTAPDNGGTPGAVNSVRVPNLGPTFSDLAHAPVIPPVNTPATVTVSVADPQGVAAVELFTAVNGAAFTSTPMTPDSRGLHSAVVPGQALSAKVQFYVRATDSLGAESFFPAAGPNSRAIIPWNDNASRFTLPSGARPHNLRVVMTAKDQTFIHTNINQMSNEKLPCTFIYDDQEVYYGASVRLKSSEHGRFNDNRVGYIVDFGRDDPFLGTHTTIAIDRSGGVEFNQYEMLIRQMMNSAGGIYSTEDDIIRIIGTKTNFTGPAILSKSRFDSEYLDGQWDNGADGTMFKYERVYIQTQTTPSLPGNEGYKYPQDSTGPPGVAVTGLGTNKELYRWWWLIRNNRAQDDYTRLMPAITALGKSGATFLAETTPLIDGSSFLRSFTPASLFGVVDNYNDNAQHNAIFYFPPGGKMVHIPWDLDFLGQSDPNAPLTQNSELNKFLGNAAWKRLYWGHVHDVLKKSFNEPFLTKWANHYTRFGVSMTGSLTYLRNRANYAWYQLNTAVPNVPFGLTTTGPLTVATTTAEVTGKGWVNVSAIRLEGTESPLPVTWTATSTWSIQLPLRGGTQTYVLEALDPDGAVLGTAPITITATAGPFLAGPGSLVVSEINYNPPEDDDLTEFLELLNITGDTLDLSGCHFDEVDGEGIAYGFPAGVQLAPGGRVLVVRNREAMTARYGATLTMAPGVFTGALSNSGERLILFAANGQEIFRFRYSDEIGSTDGGGLTLTRVLSSTAPDPGDFTWRESTALHGNPGSTDAVAFSGNPSLDSDQDGFTSLVEYAFGTSDTDPSSIPGSPVLTLGPEGTAKVVWPLRANADDVAPTTQVSSSLTPDTWAPHTGQPGPGQQFLRLHLRLR
jgi:hypothetical protein